LGATVFNFIRQRIELKLGAVFLLVVFIPITIISVISYNLIVKGIQREIQQRTISDLNVAVAIYDKIKNQLRYTIRDQSGRVGYYFDTDTLDDLPAYLAAVAEQNNLDIFLVTDRKGRVVGHSNISSRLGDNLSNDPLILKALGGEDTVSTELVAAKDLSLDGLKAAVPEEMMIRVVMALKDPDGTIKGAMEAGYLLNGNDEIVGILADLINAEAAIFQRDTIISCSLKDKNGACVGTRTSREIADIVLHDGKEYIGEDRMFGTGFMNGYVPIRNSRNEVIGSLYVRATEEGFLEIKRKMQDTIIYMAGFSILLALLIGFMVGHPLTRSIARLNQGAEAVSGGNFDIKIDVETEDELKDLADSFNIMTADLKEAQKKLLQSEKMAALGQIAAAVSHELKNPLTGIKMAAYLLKDTLGDGNVEVNKCLADIESSVDRANKIVMEILAFSQPVSPVLNPVNVNEVLTEILPLLEYQAQVHSISLVKELTAGLAPVNADKDQLKQIFENLMTNALQAMGVGGVLTLVTSQEKDSIVVKVKDTGVGIAEENIKSIFQPFFTTKDKGIGLGLAIVSEIVKKHQGTISVESRLGKGTTFTVVFPKINLKG
jgi:two-component system NtrC family sensor kinase